MELRPTAPNTYLHPIAVGFAGGAATITLWLVGYGYPDLMTAAPVGLEAAITTVIAIATSLLARLFACRHR